MERGNLFRWNHQLIVDETCLLTNNYNSLITSTFSLTMCGGTVCSGVGHAPAIVCTTAG